MTTLRAEFSAAFLKTSYASSIWAKVNEWCPSSPRGCGRRPPSSAGSGWTPCRPGHGQGDVLDPHVCMGSETGAPCTPMLAMVPPGGPGTRRSAGFGVADGLDGDVHAAPSVSAMTSATVFSPASTVSVAPNSRALSSRNLLVSIAMTREAPTVLWSGWRTATAPAPTTATLSPGRTRRRARRPRNRSAASRPGRWPARSSRCRHRVQGGVGVRDPDDFGLVPSMRCRRSSRSRRPSGSATACSAGSTHSARIW